MKRVSITIVVTLVTLALALLINAQKQKPSSGQTAANNSNTASADPGTKRKGELLVEKLPESIEGVMLRDGVVTAKPGYKFVKGKDGKVRVALVKGGGGLSVGGSWNCSCAGSKGSCSSATVGGSLSCIPAAANPCVGECNLVVVTNGVTERIMAWR